MGYDPKYRNQAKLRSRDREVRLQTRERFLPIYSHQRPITLLQSTQP